MPPFTALKTALTQTQQQVNEHLPACLPPTTNTPADRVQQAARYSLLAGGKRLRPFLLMHCAQLLGAHPAHALQAACAVEMIHTFSLIHDDLPAIDNDTLRRGQPTCHVQFDEATAILAGDYLLNAAYGILHQPETHPDPAARLHLINRTQHAVTRLIQGEMYDIQAEYGQLDVNAPTLQTIQADKTGAMMILCAELAAILAEKFGNSAEALSIYAHHLGLAFQLTDDILDVTQTADKLGKTPGKDAAQNKVTFVSLWGLDKTRTAVQDHTDKACEALTVLPDTPARTHLHNLALYVLARDA